MDPLSFVIGAFGGFALAQVLGYTFLTIREAFDALNRYEFDDATRCEMYGRPHGRGLWLRCGYERGHDGDHGMGPFHWRERAPDDGERNSRL